MKKLILLFLISYLSVSLADEWDRNPFNIASEETCETEDCKRLQSVIINPKNSNSSTSGN